MDSYALWLLSQQLANQNSLQMFGVDRAIIGTAPPLGSPSFLVQAGHTTALYINSAEIGGPGAYWPWPNEFPNGLLAIAVMMSNGQWCTPLLPECSPAVCTIGYAFGAAPGHPADELPTYTYNFIYTAIGF